MSKKKVLVLGGNFAGLTAAISMKHELGNDVDVTVVSKADHFQFNPSLIWIPFGKRKARDVAFPLAKTFEAHGVEFVHAEATKIDPPAQKVETSQGVHGYDYLVIATGYLNDFGVIPGLGPGGNAYSITSLQGAVDADLKKQRLRVPVAYVSAEPFPGHFGIGGLPGGEKLLGMFFRRQKIDAIWDEAMEEVVPGEVRLTDRRKLPFRYAMVVPPFIGADVVKASGLGNPKGFIDVKDTYQTLGYPNIYAVGIAAAVNAPWVTANAVGVPKTGFPAETMARVAAANIASQIRGQEPTKEENFADIPAVCILDAGNNGVVILADKMLPPRKRVVMIPGPQSHAAKIAFEKYFLWKARHGYVRLP